MSIGSPASAERRSKRIEPLTAQGLPNVQAQAAVVMDAATTGELFSVNPDAVRAIASTGKFFVAMVVRQRGIDLDARTKITKVDRSYARGGARTRLAVGRAFTHRDLLRAMLIASDNRAPTALGRAVGLSPDELVAAMNELARELGLSKTEFTDPSGLRGNVSTAREMAISFRTALADPVLRGIMGRRDVTVRSAGRRARSIYYRNTNRALHSKRHAVLAGKTGYTKAAGYCLVIASEHDGRDVIMVFLGTREKLTRYGDFNRVSSWLAAGRAPSVRDVARIADVLGVSSLGKAAAGVDAR